MAEESDKYEAENSEVAENNTGQSETQNLNKEAEMSSKDEEIEKLNQQLEDLNQKYRRLAAEYDNFRKRASREKEETRKYAIENVIIDLLEVLDNFERAIESARNTNDTNSIVEGIEMVYNQFYSTLNNYGLEKLACEGEEFDPYKHEALSHTDKSEHPEDTIVDVCKSGYALNSKVIRPAMVTVSKKSESNTENQSNDNENNHK
ncbi:MAG: nucleotide exchange factor GrpE [Methanohalobium sp.]|uniref:nucleotide exchange factor GrpE n=1 Tax=Methanohalobium sp. TaxID=2837493 RepID=UPI00397B6EE6